MMLNCNELAILDEYKPAEQCALDLDKELDNLLFVDGNTFRPKTCFCCDCFLLGIQESKKIFGIQRLQKCAHLFHLDDRMAHMSNDCDAAIPQDVIDYTNG